MPNLTVILAYVPVLHKGYMRMFKGYPECTEVMILSQPILDATDYIRKDLRALNPDEQVKIISGLGMFEKVGQVTFETLPSIDKPGNTIILPDEDVSRMVSEKIKKAKVVYHPIFLRWDRSAVENIDKLDDVTVISSDEFDKRIMKKALKAAGKSSDIWRRVGAVLITKTGEEMPAKSNTGEPAIFSPIMEGDPRNIFNRGVGIEMSVFTHAEAALIAEAAKIGIKLDGSSMYVSTYPCPACAKLIARSGVKTCYFKDGYAVLDGRRIMEDYGVEIVKVNLTSDETEKENPDSMIAYEKN